MILKIAKALAHVGYTEVAPTAKNLIECFKDFADHGVIRDITDAEDAQALYEAGSITLEQIINFLSHI